MGRSKMRVGLIMIVGVMLISGCGTVVNRIESEAVVDLSGAWNDTDSRLVSEEMITDALNRPWISDFQQRNRKMPVVIIGEVRNLSHEHVNVQTFVNDMERALINSGQVEFVASSSERTQIRDERADQDLHSRAGTRNAMGQEIGADYMLKGTINTIIDEASKKQVRYYQIDLTLISLADNRKVWAGQKKIKKLIKRPTVRY